MDFSIIGGLERLQAFGLIRFAAWALAGLEVCRSILQWQRVAKCTFLLTHSRVRAKSASKWGLGAGSCVVVLELLLLRACFLLVACRLCRWRLELDMSACAPLYSLLPELWIDRQKRV